METSAQYLTFIEVLKLFGGASIVLAALLGFIGKIWINRIRITDKADSDKKLKKLDAELNAKISSLKSKNETKVHVHKLQFEKEFTEYQELWKKAVIMDTNFRMLKNNATSYEKYEPALDEYYRVFIELRDYNLNAHPFYYQAVYDASTRLSLVAERCHDLVHLHHDYLGALGTEDEDKYKDYDNAKFLKDIEEYERKLGDEMKALSKVIRDRWQNMVLIENDF